MLDTPKTFSVPGFDQPLREQTLAEFVMVLEENHLVRRELRELQRRSMEAARLSAENQQLLKRVQELSLAMDLVPHEPTPEPVTLGEPAERTTAIERIPCKLCGKPIARGKGYWGKHLKMAHPKISPVDTPQE